MEDLHRTLKSLGIPHTEQEVHSQPQKVADQVPIPNATKTHNPYGSVY